jgi:hypothetical protein
VSAVAVLALSEESLHKIGSLDAKMIGHMSENGVERSYSKTAVIGDRYVVEATFTRREAHVTTCLPGDLVAVVLQQASELPARNVSRQPHAAITSSLTKWSRISFGASWPSK